MIVRLFASSRTVFSDPVIEKNFAPPESEAQESS